MQTYWSPSIEAEHPTVPEPCQLPYPVRRFIRAPSKTASTRTPPNNTLLTRQMQSGLVQGFEEYLQKRVDFATQTVSDTHDSASSGLVVKRRKRWGALTGCPTSQQVSARGGEKGAWKNMVSTQIHRRFDSAVTFATTLPAEDLIWLCRGLAELGAFRTSFCFVRPPSWTSARYPPDRCYRKGNVM